MVPPAAKLKRTKAFHWFNPRITLGVKITGLALMVAILTGNVLGFTLINISRESLHQQALQTNLVQASFGAELASLYMDSIQANIIIFANQPVALQPLLDNTPQQLPPVLDEFLRVQAKLENLSVYDNLGILKAVSSGDASATGQSFSASAWFQQVISTSLPYLGTPELSKGTGFPIIPYAVPIMDGQGKMHGVLSAEISLGKLSDVIMNHDYGANTQAAIVDFRNGGILIAHADPERIMTPVSGKNEATQRLLAGERGAIETTDSYGTRDLVGFAPVSPLPWGIMVATPTTTALALVDTLNQNAALFTIVIILAAGIFGLIMALGVTRSLRRLVEDTNKIGLGNLDYSLGAAPNDEIGDLSRAFEDMAQHLKQTLVSSDILAAEIIERKRAETENQQLRSKAEVSNRLAAIGEMSAGIAHEINNPLTGILGFSEWLAKREDLPEDVTTQLKIIADGSNQVKGIVKRLLTFGRQSKLLKTRVNINELIDATLEIRNYVLKTANIEVMKHLDPALPELMADPGQMQQVFINLIINAEHSMKQADGQGLLGIVTEKIESNIRIYFQDNGTGMSREIQDKIFNPFFTTKEVNEGTGLGLSLSHAIIAQHGGTIEVESQPGQGARFIITLPLTPVAPEPPAIEPAETPFSIDKIQAANILAVDDEEVVRELIQTILSGSVHLLDTAANLEEALQKLDGTSYDIVLLDMRMPGMSGMELYEKIKAKRPRLTRQVICMTGDALSTDIMTFLEHNKLMSIIKPFEREALLDKMRSLLAACYNSNQQIEGEANE
jgi:signal transduction histidine kinase